VVKDKFNRLERLILNLNYNFFAMVFSDLIIVDAEGMKQFIKDKYHYKTFLYLMVPL